VSDENRNDDGQLILMAHGSRHAHWLAPFQRLADDVKRNVGGERVHLCFMELASPSLEDVARQLEAQGVRHVRLLPLFLASGSHLGEDVPLQLQQIKSECPALEIEMLPPIGENPRFTAFLTDLVKQYL
jgi:sirohydrochlorin cobaltochelatase